MVKLLAVVFFTLLFFPAGQEASASLSNGAAPKKVVCSITLNSDNEINTFRKVLGEQNYKFVELVPKNGESKFGSADDDWFAEACETKVQCDTLVVSAHFAGTFFGHNTNKKLEVSQLEKLSCDSKCDGILKHPKEVYLFGCNTLAGKDKDSRSPEEYRRVLIEEHGFSAFQAEQIASFRYSPIGTTNAARMQRIFSNANWIYGFNSIAPSGQNVQSMLGRYLSQVKPYYGQSLTQASSQSAVLFSRYLSQTSAATLPGKKDNIPACFLSEDVDNIDPQIAWMQRVMLSNRALEYLPPVQEFIDNVRDSTSANYAIKKQKVEAFLTTVRANQDLKARLWAFVSRAVLGVVGVQSTVANFMAEVGWLDSTQLQNLGMSYLHSLAGSLDHPISSANADEICSLDLKISKVPFSSIPRQRLREASFIDVAKCLGIESPEIREAVLENVQNRNSEIDARRSSLWYLAYQHLNLSDNERHALMSVFADPKEDENFRMSFGQIFSKMEPFSDADINLLKSVGSDRGSSPMVRGQAWMALRRIKQIDSTYETSIVSEFIQKYVKRFGDQLDEELIGEYLQPQSDDAVMLLVSTALYGKEVQSAAFAAGTLERAHYKNKRAIKLLTAAIVDESGKSGSSYNAVFALGGFRTNDANDLLPILESMKTRRDVNSIDMSNLGRDLYVINQHAYMPEFLTAVNAAINEKGASDALQMAFMWTIGFTRAGAYYNVDE